MKKQSKKYEWKTHSFNEYDIILHAQAHAHNT